MSGSKLTVFAIEQVTHGTAARGVDFNRGTALGVFERTILFVGGLLWLAARWAAIGEAGFARIQLELLATSYTCFDWKRHSGIC